MTYLIDGYNLMHAIGLLRQGLPVGQLQRARTRFLEWLAVAAAGRAAIVRVVFDGTSARSASREMDHQWIRVRFSYRRTADDEIEELLASDPHPEQITVVSNDTRVREAGRRRGACALACEAFVDWTLERKQKPDDGFGQVPDAEKPEVAASDGEMAAWLAAFKAPPPRRRNR